MFTTDKIKKPLRELIFNNLLEDIVHGRINPGEKLLEKELAKQFEVSRTPIREALLQLEAEGYVIHTKNVGAVIKKISSNTVQETYELIAFLEGYAMEVATDKITDEDVFLFREPSEILS